jgi:hypothetical protein
MTRCIPGIIGKLDLMHVAAALNLHADLILSFDERQRKAAEAEGMRVGP